ncbi:MAG: hypothetical protein V1754_06275, partial [Pseudomonadota bacterium]
MRTLKPMQFEKLRRARTTKFAKIKSWEILGLFLVLIVGSSLFSTKGRAAPLQVKPTLRRQSSSLRVPRIRQERTTSYVNGTVPGYFKSNEPGFNNFCFSRAGRRSGGWIGTGTDQNFHLVNLLRPRGENSGPNRRPFKYIVVDTDPRVKEINTIYMLLAKLAKEHNEPRAKFYSLISSTRLPREGISNYQQLDFAEISEQFTDKPSLQALNRNLHEVRTSKL